MKNHVKPLVLEDILLNTDDISNVIPFTYCPGLRTDVNIPNGRATDDLFRHEPCVSVVMKTSQSFLVRLTLDEFHALLDKTAEVAR